MKSPLQKLSFLFLALSVSFFACKDSGSGNDGPAPVEGELVEDVAANVSTTTGTTFEPVADIPANVSTTTGTTFSPVADVEGDTESSPGYTFFDLETGAIVEDTLSDAWDIGFGGTTIIANSGNGGGIQLVEQAYADVETAPASGYSASNSSWYTYTGQAPQGPQHAVLANEGQTLIVLTPDGNYAKVQILSYYEGNPDTDSPEFADFQTRPASDYFTFNYTLKTGGSAELYHKDSFTFFDLDAGAIVEDSLSDAWDVGFNGTEIIANSGQGGGIQLVSGAYADVETAPASGYAASNSEWYTYTGAAPQGPQHAILPSEDQTLVVKTPDGNYAKIEILSYYQGNPDTNSEEFANLATRPPSRYYTFNYTLKLNGSTELYHEDTFTYYDFDNTEIVTDESSSQWDIGFNGTTIIANSENGGGIIGLNIAFSEVTEAPTEGYVASNSDWYNYTGQAASGPQHAILPIEGLTLVVRTPDDLYAKVRVLSYYLGNPDVTSQSFIDLATRPASRYYTFEFELQTDGSVNFE